MKQAEHDIFNSMAAHDYTEKITKRIKNVLSVKSVSQRDLAEKLGTSTASISKLLTGKSNLNLQTIYTICKVLNINIDDLLSDEVNMFDNPQTLVDYGQELSESFGYDQEFLIANPQRKAFRGIITEEEECYFFYTKPTISNEKKGFLKGKLYLTPSEDKRSCTAHLKLKTGKKDKNGEDIVKEYFGSVLISLPTKSCYINLISKKYSDAAFLVFSHMFLNDEKLLTRLAGCLTTSAGTNRRPVYTKAVISRVLLDEHALKEIEGQLFINSSMISVRKDVLDKEQSSDGTNNIETLLKKIEHIDAEHDLPCVQYYNIEENAIRSSSSLSAEEKISLINKLRSISSAPYYCKVSSHSDELLFDYISNLETQFHLSSQDQCNGDQ